jgi:hypothetical protein
LDKILGKSSRDDYISVCSKYEYRIRRIWIRRIWIRRIWIRSVRIRGIWIRRIWIRRIRIRRIRRREWFWIRIRRRG